MKFVYKATNKDGEIVEDKAFAEDKFALAKQLREKDLSLIAANEEGKKGFGKIVELAENFGTVSTNDKILF